MFLCDTERHQWRIKSLKFSLFLNKQATKNKNNNKNPAEKGSSCWCWRLPVGHSSDGRPPFPVPLGTRPCFTFIYWASGRKNFHPTTNHLNLLFQSCPNSFISLILRTDHVTRPPPFLPTQISRRAGRLSHFLVWHSVLFTANPQASFWKCASQSRFLLSFGCHQPSLIPRAV